jgi:hypothetical protein
MRYFMLFGLIVALLAPHNARANQNNYDMHIVPMATSSSLAITIEEKMGSAWYATKTAVTSFFAAFAPPSPVDLANRIGSHENEFWVLLGDAGYRIKEVETTMGIIPGISASFTYSRELSDSDREFLEQRLDAHAKRNSGVTARLQRAIVSILLEASETGKYKVEQLDVTFLPLPKARFVLTPIDSPGAPDNAAILRAIEALRR